MEERIFKAEELVAKESFQAYCLEIDEASIVEWEAWQEAHPEQSGVFEEAKTLVLQLALHPNSKEIEAEWTRLEKQIATPTARKRLLKPRVLAAAASVALLLSFGTWFLLQPTWQTEQTAFEETAIIQLEEGTKIVLNENSSIRYKSNLANASKREIWLEGEAYFEVEHNEKPFVVHTDRGDIRVLGTTFNVEQRAKYLQTTLIEGKVEITFASHPAFEMKPGTSILLDAKDKVSNQVFDLNKTLAWKANKSAKLLLKNVKIEMIVAQLDTDFGITLKVANASLLDRRISAPLLRNDSKLLLEALAELYDLQIEQLNATTYQLK